MINIEEYLPSIANLIDWFKKDTPVQAINGGAFVCESGSARVVLNMKTYDISAGDLICMFPYSIVQGLYVSDDFDGTAVGIDPDLLNSMKFEDKAVHFITIDENPCIKVSKEDIAKIKSLYEELLSEDPGHMYYEERLRARLSLITYAIAEMFITRKPLEKRKTSRQDQIFQKFIYDLFGDMDGHREVEYFATKQSITPRHLSLVVKTVSGYTASEYINMNMISKIKRRLYDKGATIYEISDEFNFPNASFFSQYFLRHTGMSPRDYRKTI